MGATEVAFVEEVESIKPRTDYLNDGYGWKSWLLTKDHKRIALLYLVAISFFFILGSLYAAAIRLELLTPQGDLVGATTYNKLFTHHGIMVFFFLIPSIPAVLGNFLIPLMIGAKDLAFPKLNLLSWYIYVAGGLLTLFAFIAGGVDTGWTFYTPFSSTYSNTYVTTTGLGIFIIGFSSILTGLNFIITIHTMRAPGMTWFRLPLFVWSHYATSMIFVLGTPVLAITLLLLFVQMLGTITPIFLFPGEVFSVLPYAPTLEGQYIIKNIVLVSAGIVIGATVRGGRVVSNPEDMRARTIRTQRRRVAAMRAPFPPAVLAFMLIGGLAVPSFAQRSGFNTGPPEQARQDNETPVALRDVRFEQRLNEQLPLDAVFKDEMGQAVRLGDYFGERPVILALVYYECPMLCNQVLNGLLSSVSVLSSGNFIGMTTPLNVGEQFDIVAISFDSRENERPGLAAEKKQSYVDRYNRPGAARGWHFLTGTEDQIRRVTDTVGFYFAFDPATNQFAHASGITALTPEGRIARYFYGIEYAPKDLRLGLIEASNNRIGSPVDQLLLYCYH